MHELRLIGESAQCIAEDRRSLAGLHDPEIDLLVVEASVLLLVCRSRAHEDGSGNSPRR